MSQEVAPEATSASEAVNLHAQRSHRASVSSRTHRAIRAAHQWIGAALAVVLLVVGASGALLVFRDAYYRQRYPAIAAGAIAASPDALARVESTLAAELGGRRLRVLRFPQAGLGAFHAWLDGDGEALLTSDGAHVIDTWDGATRLVPSLFSLHAHLLGGSLASTINGVAAVGGAGLAVSGVCIWWPRRGAFRLHHFVPTTRSRGSWLRSHAALGIALALPALVFCATGAALIFNTTSTSALGRWLDAEPAQRPRAYLAPSGCVARPLADLADVAQRTYPEGTVMMYLPGTATNGVATFRVRMPGESHPNGRTYVVVDPCSGRVLEAIDARRQGLGTRIGYAIYPVHAARGRANWMAVPAVITGMGLTWLAASGLATFVGWIRRGDRP